jgi:hemerythrin HHE cation binding domain-containing protein
MSMNKVIHCAVRRDLSRFRTALEKFPDGDKARAAALHTAWANFQKQLTEHHEGEHEIAWPALKAIGVPEASIATFDEEHEAMAAALRAAGEAMDALGKSGSAADAQAAGAAMATLDQATTTHFDHEERETEQLYLGKLDDPAIKTMGKQFSRRASLPVAGVFFAWMDDGASAEERAALRQSVPGPVLAIIGGIFGRKYRKEVAPVWASSGSF